MGFYVSDRLSLITLITLIALITLLTTKVIYYLETMGNYISDGPADRCLALIHHCEMAIVHDKTLIVQDEHEDHPSPGQFTVTNNPNVEETWLFLCHVGTNCN